MCRYTILRRRKRQQAVHGYGAAKIQKAVAEKLSKIIEETDTVAILYTNLDMSDFYEFKQGE